MSNWPTRYRCRKCSRATSNYPYFCSREGCPIKHDWMEDNKFWLIVIGIVVSVYGVALVGSVVTGKPW